MISFKNLSIKSKLTAIIMLTSGLALLAACIVFAAYEHATVRRSMIQELSTLANLTGLNCAAALPFDRADDAEKWLNNLKAERDITAACVYKDGQVWARYPATAPLSLFPPAPQPPGYKFNSDSLVLFQPIAEPDLGMSATIYIQSNLRKLYAHLRQYVILVGAVLLVASVLAFIISGRLQGMISRPILALAETARIVSEKKEYGVRAQAAGNDEVGVLICSFNDMLGQIEKRETELREARDGANRANQAKSNFLSFMSHELRTPLTSIIGFSEVLAAELKSENKTNWADDLRRINDSGKYLLELINDILDLSKIEAGKMEVHLETFRIGHLVADAADVLRPLIEQKSNRLVVDCAEDLGAMQADRIKVRQCLLNLLSNANKFTERGTVTLCARRKQRHGEERIIVSVTDTGIGMTTEQMGKLFRPFTQADSSTARKHGGTGLGLALTKQFCQIMGGNVGVTSEPGVGSTFTIDLPAESGRSKGSGPTPTPTPLVGQPRRGDTKIIAKRPCLLVIDDDPATHKMLGETLKPDGYELVFALSGPEGLRLAKELHPVAITLDVMMPDMDGWVVLSLLKSDPDLAAIPVIMLTVCAEQDFAFAMGVADYLKKPIDAERLTAVLEKHRPQHPPVEVLVVEDDPAMRDMIRRILEKQHWSVSEASNGKAALERISQAVPSLIILDVMMPIMDGFQMMAELQKKEEWRKIPVVVVSAKDLTAEDRARLQSNVKIVLQKGSPVRHQLMREVQETVRTFLPS